jgi:hypothetical protein
VMKASAVVEAKAQSLTRDEEKFVQQQKAKKVAINGKKNEQRAKSGTDKIHQKLAASCAARMCKCGLWR